ncbi:uncharacterized protein MONOS_294 [Monocercomonoides exilis]|uniref:uncharacterized protein n=1 Tax=Monocercomonoides exilis TaxID=2049356 RepID=UPI00355AA9D8|nr:hypothetical protein MONOS_294 [Monocercomonoides exilis]|eukprot:MONOS_294.1-p1 / transcript=MONOS_294.1 / gene=MONOS_294 / organism=Monocercomonoides_exilis_PA203 / gene_product=unspecified product / transcript_product=unspecified product / location=Mono_scaffold00005:45156-49193(-) / protein_length=941 / sequence_SO=supercontig / SO=protein_coding / is_pseudo=false
MKQTILTAFLLIEYCLISLTFSEQSVNTWAEVSSTKYFLRDHSMTYVSPNEIYVFGGADKAAAVQNSLYRLSGDKFEQLVTQEPRTELYKHAATRISVGENKLGMLVSGGIGKDGKASKKCYVLKKEQEVHWNNMEDLPEALYYHTMASTDDGKIVVAYGGFTTVDEKPLPSHNLYMYNFDKTPQKWIKITYATDKPVPPAVQSKLTFDEKQNDNYIFHLTGGRCEKSGDNVILWKLTITANGNDYTAEWTKVAYHPSALPARMGHHAHQIGPALFLWGGSSSEASFSIINTDDRTWQPLEPRSLVEPPQIHLFASCYDEDNQRVIVHGGSIFSEDKATMTDSLWYFQIDKCNQHPSCASCAENNCVWCSTKGRCIGGKAAANGDSDSALKPDAESCSVYVSDKNQCNQGDKGCWAFDSCGACTANGRCGWCQEMSGQPAASMGCFEGTATSPYLGTCVAWTSKTDECDKIEIEVACINPQVEDTLFSGTSTWVSWYTRNRQGEGLKFDVVVVYKAGQEGQQEKVLKNNVPADGFVEWSIPKDTNLQGKCNVLFRATSDQKVLLTIPVVIGEAHVEVWSPSENEVVTKDEMSISWDFSFSLEYVTLELYKDGVLNKTIASSVSNYGYYQWDAFEAKVVNGDKYTVQIKWVKEETASSASHSSASNMLVEQEGAESREKLFGKSVQQKIGESKPFSIQLSETYITITSPTKGTKLSSGEEVVIEWETNRPAKETNVYLMRGFDKQRADLVMTVASKVEKEKQKVSWVVDVDDDDYDYFFLIEDSAVTRQGTSPFFNIIATSLIPSIAGSTPGAEQHIGDKVEVEWEYHGGSSPFSVTLVPQNGQRISIATELSPDVRSFSFSLPASMEHGTLYVVEVTATNWKNGVSGTTAPFKAIAPGAFAIRSIGSVIAISVIAVAVIAALFLFYFCFYRKSRLGGFQQI